MNRYTLYCTEFQTKKALELGAPINKTHANPPLSFVDKNPKRIWVSTDDSKLDVGYVLAIPTVEQMIGFILEIGRGYSTDLSELIHEQGYKQGCLTFIDNCLK